MTQFRPGDRVVRVPPSQASSQAGKALDAGHHYFHVDTGMAAEVREVDGDVLYLVGYGDWPFHSATFRKVN